MKALVKWIDIYYVTLTNLGIFNWTYFTALTGGKRLWFVLTRQKQTNKQTHTHTKIVKLIFELKFILYVLMWWMTDVLIID